ncbi:MAG: M64 family metallopeptidase [Pseudomonadota bacterium]
MPTNTKMKIGPVVKVCALCGLLASALSSAGAETEAKTTADTRTLRVDYYHTGNANQEIFSLDRVVLEPLPWPGNTSQPFDNTLRGKYAFYVHAQDESETLLYSRSFSSIYGEWETTGEARTRVRTFHESVRFPTPAEAVDLVVKKRDQTNNFTEVWRTTVDPHGYLVHQESAVMADRVVPIQQSGDPAGKVDLLLLGDGYTAEEHDTFLAAANELTEVLFSTPPFKERRSDFNVWALAPASPQSGVSRPSTGVYRDTPFSTRYDAFRSERYVLTYANRELRSLASSAHYDFVEILVNSDVYGGGGIYGLYSTAAAKSEWAGYLFVHEFAHHFAGLADEYYTSSVAYEAPDAIREPYEPNVTAFLDPANLKWGDRVAAGTPLPTPWPKSDYEQHSRAYEGQRQRMRAQDAPEEAMNELFRENQALVEGLFSRAPHAHSVGAFEGANYQAKGYFRSEMNCIMFTRTEHFCGVCRSAIDEVIDEYITR